MHHLHRHAARRHVRLGDRPEAAADRKESGLGDQGRRQVLGEQRIEPLANAAAFGCEHGGNRQGADRQADVALADPVVLHLDRLEAAATEVADQARRPVEAGDHAETGETSLLGAAQHPHLEAGGLGDRGDQRRAVAGAAHRLGREHVDARHLHGIADRAEAAAGLDGARKARLAEPPGLRKPLAEAAERFLVETREGCPAELVVDHEAHRIGADVDHGMMRARASNPRRIELERAPRPALGSLARPHSLVSLSCQARRARRAWRRTGARFGLG